MTEQEELARAQFAQGLLKDEQWQALLETLRDKYIRAWQKATELSSRELAWHRTQVLEDLVHELEVASERPKFTQAQREALSS